MIPLAGIIAVEIAGYAAAGYGMGRGLAAGLSHRRRRAARKHRSSRRRSVR